MHCLTNLLYFDILLLHHYTNFNSSIICCLFSGDIYLSLSISLLASSFSERNSIEDIFEAFITLPVVLLPIKAPVAFAVF